jgi:hypothetical protein
MMGVSLQAVTPPGQDTPPAEESQPEAVEEKLPTTAISIKAGSFGVPDALLDLFIVEHPGVQGINYAFEIRTFGERGLQSPFTGLYSFEYNRMTGDGLWRIQEHDRQLSGSGEITQVSLTATVILNLFPKLPVHPYFGAGIGVAKVNIWSEGSYTDELGTEVKQTFDRTYILPVAHLPAGISVNLMNKVEIRIEGGFKNGFYLSGCVGYCF